MTANEIACRNDRLIVRENQPANLESPFELLDGLLTPNHLFYVRNHFPVPHLDARIHELVISGAIQNPFTIRFEELRAMPDETRIATMECAGNSRVFLSPPVDGVQWQLGAIGTAEWTGVPLSVLLNRAGLQDHALEVVLEGADHGIPNEKPVPSREISYARSIPMSKVPDVLIAHTMNGEDLSPEHGYPVRALVPGHYGMASVKWLTSIRVTDKSFQGYFQTTDYAYWNDASSAERVPLTEMSLKSQIARPRVEESIAAGSLYRVFGAAWSADTVESVEFSDDDGQSWHEARLLDPAQSGIWRRWEFEWKVPANPGTRILKSRARDSECRLQPEQHDNRYGTYVIAHVLPVPVTIHP